MRATFQSVLAGVDRQAWVRFFVAVAGLAIAFGAALLSTAFRQAGKTMESVLFASLALLIAGAVGVTSVPYLARRVTLAGMRQAFQYDVTREGVAYFVLLLIIGIAALNTGNNLLFIVVAAMLAAIIVSGVASAAVLRGLDLGVSLAARIFARRSVMARLTLENARRWMPAFSVTVAPPKPVKGHRHLRFRRSIFAFPDKRPLERQWVRWPDWSIEYAAPEAPDPGRGRIFNSSVYFPYIPARGTVTADVELNFPRRGRYVQDGFGIATRFPFSFLVKTRPVALQHAIIVYPSVEPTEAFFEVLPMITGEFEAFVRGRGYDLYRIREYMPEDDARHVDWKATAKSGSLKVREFTREDERKLRIVFDNPPPGAVDEKAYENAVALAASLAWHFAGEATDLSFAAPGYSGSPDIYDFLTCLALIEPAAEESILEKLEVTDDYNVILTARARGSIPTRLWASSYFIFLEPAAAKAS
jgi:uncharacterized protein (DUF58 family)